LSNKDTSIVDRHAWVKRTHHVFDTTLKGWSDQQLILGLATSGALINEWCSFSTYHVNLIKQWLIFCSITHVNSLFVHCDYFNPNHTAANIIRFLLIISHTVLATYVIAFYDQTADNWTPTVGNLTPLQALKAACYFDNATRSDTLDDVNLGWGEVGFNWNSARVLFISSLSLIGCALIFIYVDFKWRNARKSWTLYIFRSALLLFNVAIGFAALHGTVNLREYMMNFKWLKDEEERRVSYGQFVAMFLAVSVLITAGESYSGKQTSFSSGVD